MRRTVALAALALAALAAALAAPARRAIAQGSFVNFESPVSPHALVVSGGRLLVVNTPDARLSVFELGDGAPALAGEIPVGLEPVAVAARPGSPDEAWVANHLSDDVSIVDLARGITVASIPLPDEPADILFAKDGSKAYVTCSQANQVVVVGAQTRSILATFDIPMEEPRALALSPNGKWLLISVFESGNRTTVVPAELAPASDPQVGLIVPDSDPLAPVVLPDKDLFAINTYTDTLKPKAVKGVGTINFAVGVNPANGKVYVANTEARNLVQFEPNLRGHFIDSCVTVITKSGPSVTVAPVDLNPDIDYGILPNPAAKAIALSQPAAVAFDPQSGKVYVAAFGSAKVGVLSSDGTILARIDVGLGPRALAFDAGGGRLFVLNRLDLTVSEIDAASDTVTRTFPVAAEGFDPTPGVIRDGRPILYDARLSGNGTASCAACHVDARSDHLAWDLGIPDAPPDPTFPPRKGPMFTQSLADLGPSFPYHWRGDRLSLLDFAITFRDLLGEAQPMGEPEMQALQAFLFTVRYPPNPNQPRDRSFSPLAQIGVGRFFDPGVFGGGLACATCHVLPYGTQDIVIPGVILNESQGFNMPVLLGLNEKLAFERTGFAFLHDGSKPSIRDFLSTSPPFPAFSEADLDAFEAMLMEFDTRTAPAVGRRVTVDAATVGDPATMAAVAEMVAEVPRVHADVVAHGEVDGTVVGLWFDPEIGRFVSDRSGEPNLTVDKIGVLAAQGRAVLTVTAVPVGSGPRLGIDRDDDDLRDRDEAALGTNPLDPDSDDDGALDGIEVAAGSDPLDGGSTPQVQSAPMILGFAPADAAPWPLFQRITLTGWDIRHGAMLVITLQGVSREIPIFPIGPETWAAFEDVENTSGDSFHGMELQVRNRDGGLSPVFVVL